MSELAGKVIRNQRSVVSLERSDGRVSTIIATGVDCLPWRIQNSSTPVFFKARLILSLARDPYVGVGVPAMAVSFSRQWRCLPIANLSFAVPATAFSYVLETALAKYILKEHIGWRRWAGASLRWATFRKWSILTRQTIVGWVSSLIMAGDWSGLFHSNGSSGRDGLYCICVSLRRSTSSTSQLVTIHL
jgi:hypothetical protein